MYRWHFPDPVNFERELKVTIHDLGWRPDGRYLARSDDMASVAYWYSEHPAGLRTGQIEFSFHCYADPGEACVRFQPDGCPEWPRTSDRFGPDYAH